MDPKIPRKARAKLNHLYHDDDLPRSDDLSGRVVDCRRRLEKLWKILKVDVVWKSEEKKN